MSLLLLIFISIAEAYMTYSPKEAMSACAACLDRPQARFCLDSKTSTYACCGQGENSIFCNPSETISCSRYAKRLKLMIARAFSATAFAPQTCKLAIATNPLSSFAQRYRSSPTLRTASMYISCHQVACASMRSM